MAKFAKFSIGFAGLFMASAFAFADVDVSFSNELKSDVISSVSTKRPNEDKIITETAFAGFANETIAEVHTDKVSAGLEIHSFINSRKYRNSDNDKKSYLEFSGYTVKDYWIEFSPVKILALGFHDTINALGSYLPVWDDNLASGNLGSDFVFVLKPVDGLKIAGGIDFISTIGVINPASVQKPDEEIRATNLKTNLGVEYVADNELWSIGFTARNIFDDGRSFGLYGSFSGLDNWTFMGGFAINDEGVEGPLNVKVGGNILSAAIIYEHKKFDLSAELVTNFGNKNANVFDFYTAADFTYYFSKNFQASITGKYVGDIVVPDNSSEDTTNFFGVHPYVTYKYRRHTFEAGANIDFGTKPNAKNTVAVLTLPVSWKYEY